MLYLSNKLFYKKFLSMKNLKYLFIAFSFIFVFTACESDDDELIDCYTCETTNTEYCYEVGNSYYTRTVNSTDIDTELSGRTWSEVRTSLVQECNGNLPNTDCYTCSDTNTQYCYTLENDFYTVSIAGSSAVEINLNGSTWTELVTGFEANCVTTTDCYSCSDTDTEYCFTEGNDFYTTSVAGSTPEETSLNGSTWSELRTGFEANCTDNTNYQSLVGDWKVIDFHGTSDSTTTVGGISSSISSVQTGTVYNAFINFTDTEYTTSGEMTIHSVITDPIGNVTEDDQVSNPVENGTWSIVGDQFTTTYNGESTIATITERTDNEMTFFTILNETIDENGVIIVVEAEFYQTIERQ